MRARSTVWSLLAAMLASLLAASYAAAAHRTAFTPGLWQGKGRITGGFTNGNGTDAHIAQGGEFEFCLRIHPDGIVDFSASHWAIEPTSISVTVNGGTGRGDFDAEGKFIGETTDAAFTLIGNESIKMTVELAGQTIEVPTSVQGVQMDLDDHRGPAGTVIGDFALGIHKTQEASGFTSNEQGAYVARRVRSCVVTSPPQLG